MTPISPDFYITSNDNPKIKSAKALRNRRDRDEMGLFLIEGYRELLRASEGAVEFQSIFYSPSHFLGKNEQQLLFSCKKRGAQLIETDTTLFEKISYRDRPDGLLGIAKKFSVPISQVQAKIAQKGSAPLCIIAEAIEKPGNLGTILRSADAAGVDAVLIANGCTDIYNPNVVRASVGTLFTIPVLDLSNEETLSFCRDLNLSLIAASPEATSSYTNTPMIGPIGIIVGTEQIGLTPFWKKNADVLAKIPMKGAADSLNVATATTLFLFEALRQRGI
ncbi:MAG: RNA methyltransferase [Chlamydia sp.]